MSHCGENKSKFKVNLNKSMPSGSTFWPIATFQQLKKNLPYFPLYWQVKNGNKSLEINTPKLEVEKLETSCNCCGVGKHQWSIIPIYFFLCLFFNLTFFMINVRSGCPPISLPMVNNFCNYKRHPLFTFCRTFISLYFYGKFSVL